MCAAAPGSPAGRMPRSPGRTRCVLAHRTGSRHPHFTESTALGERQRTCGMEFNSPNREDDTLDSETDLREERTATLMQLRAKTTMMVHYPVQTADSPSPHPEP